MWFPYCFSHIDDIKKVRHKFFRLAARHGGQSMPLFTPNYDEIPNNLNLQTLSKRRVMFDVLFLSKIIESIIPCFIFASSLFMFLHDALEIIICSILINTARLMVILIVSIVR